MANKKKNKNNPVKDVKNMEYDDSIKKKILIIAIVIICILLFYFLAVYLINNDTSSVDSMSDNVDVVIDYDKIVFGDSFNKDGEYYVIYYDASDSDIKNRVISIVSPYRAQKESLRVYEVDMSSAFNIDYNITEEVNKNPSNIEELYINGITLIKFSDGKVVDYINDMDSIKNILKVENSEGGE